MNSVSFICAPVAGAISLRTRAKQAAAGLEISNPEDVVISHSLGNVFGRLQASVS